MSLSQRRMEDTAKVPNECDIMLDLEWGQMTMGLN